MGMLPAGCEMENYQNNARRTKLILVCGVLFLSAVTASWTLSEKTLDNHECFVSITAREMLQSGDWIVPTCNGQPRLQKTPLSYWLVAGLAKITGEVDEFTARLPSAIFGVLSVAAILYFVSQWLSFRIAAVSSAVWATSLAYIRESHNAKPEIALTFFVTLCFLTFYSAVNEKNRRKQVVYMLIFWVSFGLGMLAKGPAPLPLVLVPLFFYIAIFRQWKKIAKLLPVIGTIIFLAIVLPWPLAIAHRVNWDLVVWKHNFVDRFFGSFASGHKPFYYYLPKMFQFIVPWVAFLPMALAAPFYRVWNKKRPAMQFLWLWFVVGIGFLTLCGGKRQHYIVPLMPAMAILIGILLEDMVFTRKAYTAKYARDVLRNHIVVIVAGAIAGVIYIAKTNPQSTTHAVILGIATIVLTAAVAVLFAIRRPALGCGATFAGIGVLVMISYVSFINPLDYNKYSRKFSRKVSEIVPQSEKLIAYKSASTRFIHYFGRRVPKVQTKSEVNKLYSNGCWVVAFGRYLNELLDNERFEIVYMQENAERHGQDVVGGVLLHKLAPAIRSDS